MPAPPDESHDSRPAPRLMQLRVAQLRNRIIRGGLIKIAFGTLFLIGSLAHALSPQRHESSSVLWMTMLLLSSTVNVAWGLRALSRARRIRGPFWIFASAAWALLALLLLGLLLRR